MKAVAVGIVGLWLVSSTFAQTELEVGYSVVVPHASSPPPFSVVLLSSRDPQGNLIWETGLQASPAISEGLIFVDQRPGKRTGLALLNVGTASVSVLLQLRDAGGLLLSERHLQLQAGERLAGFLNELLGVQLPAATGTLRFSSETTTPQLAAVTLREGRNARGEALFSTLSAGASGTPVDSETLILPQVGAGDGLSTEIVLTNPRGEPISGRVLIVSSSPTPFEREGSTLTTGFDYTIPPWAAFYTLLENPQNLTAGYALVVPDSESPAPEARGLFQFHGDEGLLSEAGVEGRLATTSARAYIDNTGSRTGLAVAVPGDKPSALTFRLIDGSGAFIAQMQRNVAPGGHLATFSDELFTDLPPGFTGTIEIQSDYPFALTSLRLTVNQRGEPIMTTLPVVDPSSPPLDSTIFPQMGFGGGFSSRFLFMNFSLSETSESTLLFRRSNGGDMPVPLYGDAVSDVLLDIGAGGRADLRPGRLISLRGRVEDRSTRAPVAGALVSSTLLGETAVSDGNGNFVLHSRLGAEQLFQTDTLTICASGYAARAEHGELTDLARESDYLLTPIAGGGCGIRPNVSIASASIPGNQVVVELLPLAAWGTLKLEVAGPDVSYPLAEEARFSGRHSLLLRPQSLPIGEFDHLTATWTVGGSSTSRDFPFRFKVLGDYLHTRYNVPDEQSCSGSPQPFCYNDGDCTLPPCQWQTGGTGKSGWLEEVLQNGSGFSQTLGFVSLEWFCSSPLECSLALRNLTVDSGCPACPGGSLADGSTVAVRPDHPDLGCGDRVFILDLGVRLISDHGQLPALDQLDHFAGVSGCNAPDSIGRRRTIKLYE